MAFRGFQNHIHVHFQKSKALGHIQDRAPHLFRPHLWQAFGTILEKK